MSRGNPLLPDTGGVCCIGAAEYGPSRCTCWEPVYDLEQAPAQEGPHAARSSMCGDCAFRKDSPERSGDKRYANSGPEELDDLVARADTPFLCHQGMRRVVALVHPSGARVEMDCDAYAPLDNRCKADGSPADACAGFLAARTRAQKGPTR